MDRQGKTRSVLIGGSIAGLLLALVLLRLGWHGTDAASASGGVDAAAVAPSEVRSAATAVDVAALSALGERVAQLEAQVAQLAASVAASRTPVPEPVAGPATDARSPAAGDALEQRVTALEYQVHGTRRQLSTLAAATTAANADSAPGVAPPAAPSTSPEERKAIAERVLADPAATVAEKVAAHEQLRRVADAYTPAMVDELVRIATTHPVPEVRGRVWTMFDGSSRVPQLVPHLLRALTVETAGVRAEVAETLGNYADDPAVLQALRHAAQHDTDASVREKARRTTGPPASWRR